ncbi:NAM-associated domain-containing protein [Abeliophyllum distichum]|uniref:NAM-associated domain-containing protein n=1 Tax=Abeliophyllum distichum TaxID=126358 RepID=A0ABD1V6A5_9LAMI
MNESNKHRSSNGNTPATHENVVNLGDESMRSTGINSDEVVRPQGRKGCKEKRRRLNDENGVVDVLKKLQCTLEKHIEFNQKELELKREKDMKQFEMREQTLRKDLELKDTAQKLKIKDQELRERAQKRQEQHRIMNQDISKLTPALRKTYEIYQAKILKEWENDDLFGNDIQL